MAIIPIALVAFAVETDIFFLFLFLFLTFHLQKVSSNWNDLVLAVPISCPVSWDGQVSDREHQNRFIYRFVKVTGFLFFVLLLISRIEGGSGRRRGQIERRRRRWVGTIPSTSPPPRRGKSPSSKRSSILSTRLHIYLPFSYFLLPRLGPTYLGPFFFFDFGSFMLFLSACTWSFTMHFRLLLFRMGIFFWDVDKLIFKLIRRRRNESWILFLCSKYRRLFIWENSMGKPSFVGIWMFGFEYKM